MEPTVPEENNGFRVLAPPSHLVPCCPQESRYLAFSRAAIWSVVPTFPASCYAVRWQIRWQLDLGMTLDDDQKSSPLSCRENAQDQSRAWMVSGKNQSDYTFHGRPSSPLLAEKGGLLRRHC